LIDFGKRKSVGDQRVNFELAAQLPVNDFRNIRAASSTPNAVPFQTRRSIQRFATLLGFVGSRTTLFLSHIVPKVLNFAFLIVLHFHDDVGMIHRRVEPDASSLSLGRYPFDPAGVLGPHVNMVFEAGLYPDPFAKFVCARVNVRDVIVGKYRS
jgi:hypothetical protein